MGRLSIHARKDLMDGVRTRQLPVTVVVFAVVGFGIGYIVGGAIGSRASVLAATLLGALLFLGPLIGIYLSYSVIVSKRESGELKVLLGLPFSRAEIVFGAVLGRVAILGLSVTAAVLAGVIGGALTGGMPAAPQILSLLGFGLAMMVVFVSIGVGISANCRHSSRAAGLAFLAFVLFGFRVWELLPQLIDVILVQLSLPRLPPAAIDLYLQATPHAALRNVVELLRPELVSSFQPFVGAPPASPLLGVTVFAGWLIGPLAIAYYRFGTADLAG
ncbi:MAG: ABC transporter permease subunit [Salinirussus sp.]